MATTYAEKLRHPKWQKKRLKVLNRDKYTCQLCGDKETELHVHHKTYEKDPLETDVAMLICLCKHCHKVIEVYKKQSKIELFPSVCYKILIADKCIVFAMFYFWESGRPRITAWEYNEKTSDVIEININKYLTTEAQNYIINNWTCRACGHLNSKSAIRCFLCNWEKKYFKDLDLHKL